MLLYMYNTTLCSHAKVRPLVHRSSCLDTKFIVTDMQEFLFTYMCIIERGLYPNYYAMCVCVLSLGHFVF